MEFYNELFDNNGLVRPQYSAVYNHWKRVPRSKRRNLHRKSSQYFSGEYGQDPFPRILTNSEAELLRQGVDQRARAIFAFLCDYVCQGKRWRRIMPEYLLTSIMNRHHNVNFLRQLNPDLIAFPYGPDVIRNRAGEWRIVEDSAGILGGIGDLLQNRKTLFKLVPKFRNSMRLICDPIVFYQELANHYLKKAADNKGLALMYLRDYHVEADRETRRLAAIFKKLDILVTTPSDRTKKIVFENGTAYLKSGRSKNKIGSLILHSSPEQFEVQSFLLLIEQFKKRRLDLKSLMLTHHASLLTKCLVSGKAWTNFSPGIQFVNDKIFGLYVDSMIHRLLVEEPILKTIPSQGFSVRRSSGQWELDKNLVTKLRRNRHQYVVKKVDEDGGSGVWIGQRESKSSLEEIIQNVQRQPENYLLQHFEHLSVLDNCIVDLRIHSHVDRERIIVSNTPWGRANWLTGDGKVNISTKGFGSPVVVVD